MVEHCSKKFPVVLDKFLKQKNAIVSSMIVATKSNKSFGSLSLVDVVAKIIGIKNIKTVSQYSTLAELGVDSMMGTELVKTLEKDFDIFITSNELKSLTLSRHLFSVFSINQYRFLFFYLD